MTDYEPRWSDGTQTGCPDLTYFDDYPVGRWLAWRTWPQCPKKTCGMTECHRFGRDYQPEVSRGVARFQIVMVR